MLAVLDGWDYDMEDVDEPKIIKAGDVYVLKEHKIPKTLVHAGWIMACTGVFTHPDAEITFDYDRHHFDFKLSEYFGVAGLVHPNPWGVFVPVYDTTANVYAIHYMPNRPLSYRKYMKIACVAPKDADVTMLYAAYFGVVITDKELFDEGIRRLNLQPKSQG